MRRSAVGVMSNVAAPRTILGRVRAVWVSAESPGQGPQQPARATVSSTESNRSSTESNRSDLTSLGVAALGHMSDPPPTVRSGRGAGLRPFCWRCSRRSLRRPPPWRRVTVGGLAVGHWLGDRPTPVGRCPSGAYSAAARLPIHRMRPWEGLRHLQSNPFGASDTPRATVRAV